MTDQEKDASLERIADEVSGIGSATVEKIREEGYEDAEDLGRLSFSELTDIPGLGGSYAANLYGYLDRNGFRVQESAREKNLEKLKRYLRDMFRVDSDLNVGIDRIIKQKSDQIEGFLGLNENSSYQGKDLEEIVDDAFDRFKANEENARDQLNQKKQQIRETISPDAIYDDGSVNPDHEDANIVQEYKELRSTFRGQQDIKDLEAEIFNDIYRFFDRYYDEGDFISQRRRTSGEPKYSIPYDGEEVKLHWANKDQYYIKTGEKYQNYGFDIPGSDRSVQFEIVQASRPRNNVKEDADRYFVLTDKDPLEVDGETLTIQFEHRSLSDEEFEELGVSKQSRSTRANVGEAVAEQVFEQIEADEWLNDLQQPGKKDAPLLTQHVIKFSRKNERDYFIHKNLGEFLNNELDYFLKNEVQNLELLNPGHEDVFKRHLTRVQVTRQVAEKIIDFLAQLEDFQRQLFEKKKFVLQTEYCFTLDLVPEKFYKKILRNEQQIEVWKRIYAIDEWDEDLQFEREINREFLYQNTHMMIDTDLFPEKFKWELIDEISSDNDIGLEEFLEGNLVRGENFQSIKTIHSKFQNQISTIHIDPPYNTSTSGFLYKNRFKHSSWLSMMNDRINVGVDLLNEEGDLQCHIDENEQERLHLLFDSFPLKDLGTVIWDKQNPMLGKKGIATQHEYILWHSLNKRPVYMRNEAIKKILSKAEEIIENEGEINERVREKFSTWIKEQDDLSGGEKAYKYIDDQGRVFRGVAMGAPEPRDNPKFHRPLKHPETGKECPVPDNGWSRAPETMQKLKENNLILFGDDETKQPEKKVILDLDSNKQLSSLLEDRVVKEAKGGKSYLDDLGLEFSYSHPVSVYEEMIFASTKDGDVVMDYFSGSGTTAEAVLNLNREEKGQREYFLIEMGKYFETTIKPRIQKVVFSENWDDGVPKDNNGQTHSFKYQYLESYEDAINNIEFESSKNKPSLFDDEFLLNYMLHFESSNSRTLLSVDQFDRPFDYKLSIYREDEHQEVAVDLVETFNNLIGLWVDNLHYLEDHQGRDYVVVTGGTNENDREDRVVVIWRNLEGTEEDPLPKLDFEQERGFLEEKVLNGDEDRIYVNGDSVIPESESLEPMFQRRMMESVN